MSFYCHSERSKRIGEYATRSEVDFRTFDEVGGLLFLGHGTLAAEDHLQGTTFAKTDDFAIFNVFSFQ